ncbi:hypothetical protein AB1Y20_008531 [Prymnesium parvum]|uniref:Uncharacterized protein n=1 Tax=Prymnesium parvum TaxID=97485 RepID=A0AB34IRI6_PRYPA
MADDVDEKGSTYTVGCRLDKLLPNAQHVDAIRAAVERMQRVMIDTCDLMNLYIRDRLQNHEGSGLEHVFERNWLLYAMNEVTAGSDRATHLPALTSVRVAHMGGLVRSPRASLRQLMSNQRTNLAAVASTNIWLHFRARLVRVVTTAMRLPKEEYDALSTEERKERAIQIRSIAVDIIRPAGAAYKSSEQYHAVVDARRNILGIDEAVGGTTKYGQQCKRNTLRLVNNQPYCWQHVEQIHSLSSRKCGEPSNQNTASADEILAFMEQNFSSLTVDKVQMDPEQNTDRVPIVQGGEVIPNEYVVRYECGVNVFCPENPGGFKEDMLSVKVLVTPLGACSDCFWIRQSEGVEISFPLHVYIPLRDECEYIKVLHYDDACVDGETNSLLVGSQAEVLEHDVWLLSGKHPVLFETMAMQGAG